MKAGTKVRVLAVMSDKRLPGDLANRCPTAKELGFDIDWPIVRGFYVGPKVSDADYQGLDRHVRQAARQRPPSTSCASSAACTRWR